MRVSADVKPCLPCDGRKVVRGVHSQAEKCMRTWICSGGGRVSSTMIKREQTCSRCKNRGVRSFGSRVPQGLSRLAGNACKSLLGTSHFGSGGSFGSEAPSRQLASSCCSNAIRLFAEIAGEGRVEIA